MYDYEKQTDFNHHVIFGGKSLWSEKDARRVTVEAVQLRFFCSDDRHDAPWGELLIKFDTKTWDTKTDGLIYTDDTFEFEVQTLLNAMGLPGEGVTYSEQGMQGDDYVSMDASPEFVKAWLAKEAAANV